MKNLLKYNLILFALFMLISTLVKAQLISDDHVSKNYYCSSCYLKSASTNSFKMLRVNVHFILRSNGTANFSETTNLNDNQSSENGYWFAKVMIDAANNYLDNNLEMTQQLSTSPIPVEDINYNYKLNGVFFHRSDAYFECYYSPSALSRNNGSAINVFLFTGSDGRGAAGFDRCWIGGMAQAYTDYSSSSNIWFLQNEAKPLNHEIGHILSLDHPKRRSDGDKSIFGGIQYIDGCTDTPSFMELINDGYSDPYEWCNNEFSNNLMDYSCDQRALTPCQINQVHSYIETSFTDYLYGNFQTSSLQITSFSDNTAYIAETVEIPSGSSITIPNNKKLFIEAKQFVVNGGFEVPNGSTFEFTPYGI